jgi:mRNA-degrading endonuclease toxin of MazEF toxin-antitoxin module
MLVSRGGLYAAPRDDDVNWWLVLTNDDWNAHMSAVVAVPLTTLDGNSRQLPHTVPVDSAIGLEPSEPRYVAVVPWLAALPKEDLGPLFVQAGSKLIEQVEQSLIDLLDLRVVLGRPPAPSAPVGTASQVPRWAEIYYGPPQGVPAQHKRYVVVSNNGWNASAMRSVLCVRTTTSAKRSGDAFPAIEAGQARACCGELRALSKRLLDLRSRPRPPSLSLDDMRAVAQGVADVLELRI